MGEESHSEHSPTGHDCDRSTTSAALGHGIILCYALIKSVCVGRHKVTEFQIYIQKRNKEYSKRAEQWFNFNLHLFSPQNEPNFYWLSKVIYVYLYVIFFNKYTSIYIAKAHIIWEKKDLHTSENYKMIGKNKIH